MNSRNPRANPLIARVLRQEEHRASRQLSLRACLWLAFGLGLAGLTGSTWRVLNTATNEVGVGMGLILFAGWMFHGTMPLIMASAAAAFTRRTLQAGDFELLLMTPISNDTLVRGFVFSALYRMRYALALLIALMPLLVVGTFSLLLAIETSLLAFYSVTPPTYWEIVTPTLAAMVILVGLWGMTLLGAAVGVQSALTRRHIASAALFAPASVFLLMLCPLLLCGITAPALSASSSGQTVCLVIGAALAILAGPHVIAASIMHTAADQWGDSRADR